MPPKHSQNIVPAVDSESQGPARLRFGPAGRFELQPAERRLLVDGQVAALGGRALDLLVALASQPDHLFTKSELLDRVWPNLVVEEANLQMQISNLRKALGGDAIATVPGRGYRFVAPLAGAAEPVAKATPPAEAAAPPRRPGGLFGRDVDLARLEGLLRSARCVTLVGPAGVGKTSLARVAAARFAPQSVWVDAAPLTHGDQLIGAVARALDAPLTDGDPAPQLPRALQGRELLLVLDNAEHLVQACAELASLLSALPGLRLLVTSQLPLAVATEHVQRLEPLSLPSPGDNAADPDDDGALGLLLQRVVAADHRFQVGATSRAALVEICTRLDGLPLALEMAAARVPLMGLNGVREALAQRFELLTRGHRDSAARHRTLHNALDWSYRLLSPGEQRLFRALGGFVGGFTLELAVALMSDESGLPDAPARWDVIDGLAALVDRSLVTVSADDPPRYRLLETMRAFALQQMAAHGDEIERTRRSHAHVLSALFWRCQPGDADAHCLAEMENACEAAAWAQLHDLCRAAQLCARATRISTFSVWRNECTRWLRALQPAMDSPAGLALPADVQATWWTEMGRTATFLGDPQASAAGRRAVALWQPLRQPGAALFAAVVWVRAIALAGDELDQACAALRALAAELADATARERFWIHGALTKAALTRGDFAAVLEGRLAEMDLARELGQDEMVDAAESNVVHALNGLGRHAEAAERGARLLARIDLHNADANANLPWVLSGLIKALIEAQRLDEALTLVPRACAAGQRYATLVILPVLAWLAASRGQFEAAARLVGHARQRFESRRAVLDSGEERLLQRAQAAAAAVLQATRVDELYATADRSATTRPRPWQRTTTLSLPVAEPSTLVLDHAHRDTPFMEATSASVKPQKNFRSTTCARSGSTASSFSSASPMPSSVSGCSTWSALSVSRDVITTSPPRFCA